MKLQALRNASSSPFQLSPLGPKTNVVSDTAVHHTQTGADTIVMAKSERLNSLNSCEAEAFAAAAPAVNT